MTREAQDLQEKPKANKVRLAPMPTGRNPRPALPLPSPPSTLALQRRWAIGTPAPPAVQSALQCCLSSGCGHPCAAPRTAAQLCPLTCGQEYKLQEVGRGLWVFLVSPWLGLWCIPDVATRAGPLEARPEVGEVPGAKWPIFGSIKLSKKVCGEVRWS